MTEYHILHGWRNETWRSEHARHRDRSNGGTCFEARLRPFLTGNRIVAWWGSRSRAVACPRAFPGGLLGSIGLIIALECVGIVPETLRIRGSSDRVNVSWRAAGRAAAGPEAGAEILCFGDSLIKLGILPRVLESRLGWSAHNLAVLGGQAPTSYFLLRRVLEQGHRPRALIINFSPLLLAMDPRVNLEWWSRLPDGCERLELLWRARDPSLTASMTVQSLIASWSARDAVRSVLGPGRRRGSIRTSHHDPRRRSGFRAELAVEPRFTGRSPAFRSDRGGLAETLREQPMEMATPSGACLLRGPVLEPRRRSSNPGLLGPDPGHVRMAGPERRGRDDRRLPSIRPRPGRPIPWTDRPGCAGRGLGSLGFPRPDSPESRRSRPTDPLRCRIDPPMPRSIVGRLAVAQAGRDRRSIFEPIPGSPGRPRPIAGGGQSAGERIGLEGGLR